MTFTSEALVMSEIGAAEVLEMREISLPWPGNPDDVLVRLQASSVNPADTFFRAFGPYLGEAPGTVLGHDGAGIVEAVGAAVGSLRPGDRVCFCNGGLGGDAGTYARHAVVPEWLLARVPDNVEIGAAVALPLVFITAWEAIVERGRASPGESLLVHGGAGGTGQIAIQVARRQGARVAATVSGADKAKRVVSLGAEIAINYRDEDFVASARRWSGGRGVDLAFDNAGAEVFRRTLAAMAPYGRIVTLMGTPGDVEEETAYNLNLSIHNVMMLTPMWLGLERERRRQGEIVRRAMDWLGQGKVEVEIGASFPLREAANAHRLLEQGGMRGKIVLTID